MKTVIHAAIQDTDALRALSAEAFNAYLSRHDWIHDRSLDDRAAIWLKQIDAEEFEIMVPLKLSLGDYALRMMEAMQTLSVVEERSQLEIYAEICNTPIGYRK